VLDLIVLCSIAQDPSESLKTSWLKVIWISLKVRSVDFNSEENSLLNACVLLRSKNIATIPDPLLSLALLRDEQRLSLGEFIDDSYHLS
jgi:hypothetical protein